MNYLKDNYLKLEDMKFGQLYRGIGRNFNYGSWNGEGFLGDRSKFGEVFEDLEYHYDSDPKHGTFQPLEEVEDL